LFNQCIVLLQLLVFAIDVELEALLVALQSHNLFVQVRHLHALLHALLIDLVTAVPQLLHLSFKLVKVVEFRHGN